MSGVEFDQVYLSFFSFQSISVCPKYHPQPFKRDAWYHDASSTLSTQTITGRLTKAMIMTISISQWQWQFKWNENDKDKDNASQQGCQEFRDDTPSARIRSLWSHCTFPACPNAQMPTQMPGLLTQYLNSVHLDAQYSGPPVAHPNVFTLHCVLSNTHRHNWWATESAIVYIISASRQQCIFY